MRKRINARVIDDLIDAYADWCEEAAEVEYAYLRWSVTPASDAARAFAAYAAALAREELAAIPYARVIRRASVLLARDRRRRLALVRRRRGVRGRGTGHRCRRRTRGLAREAASRAGRTRSLRRPVGSGGRGRSRARGR
jgi:hypothetical protein